MSPQSKNDSQLIVGPVSTIAKGAGFIDDPKNEDQSIYIEPGMLNTALNRDVVEVRVIGTQVKQCKKERTGEVVRVVTRARDKFVGIVAEESGKLVVIPDDRKMYVKIDLSDDEIKKVSKDDKVHVQLNPWTDPKKILKGKFFVFSEKKA